MWRLWLGVAALAILTVTTNALGPRPAFACSVGPDFDPVATSDVIVEGRFLGFEVLPDAPYPRMGAFVPVRVDMSVERVYKGEVATDVIPIVDPRTLLPPRPGREEYAWVGASGACGAFDFDPTGSYAIMGLTERNDGTYETNRPIVFFMGDGPGAEGYRWAMERMASFPGAAELPALGSGPLSQGDGRPMILMAGGVVALGGVLLAAGAVIRRRGRASFGS
jgi:hypothetical protein